VYPIAIYICFNYYCDKKELIYYVLPLSIFIFCDPLAALVGGKTNWVPYRVISGYKTMAGSITFFGGAFLLSLFLFILKTNVENVFFLSFTIAVTSTVTEAVSPWGADNLTVPLSSLLVLQLFHV